MNSFSVTLTQEQANLIFKALQFYVADSQKAASELVKYIDEEFVKANSPEKVEPVAE